MGEDPKKEPSDVFDLAALTQRLAQEADGSAEREAYLEKLKQKIAAGEYQTDSEKLARRLMEEFDQRPEGDAK